MTGNNLGETPQTPFELTTEKPVSPESDDEYDFPELTEHEFAQIDAIFDSHLNWNSLHTKGDPVLGVAVETISDGPRVVIEVEREVGLDTGVMSAYTRRDDFLSYGQISPFDKYRSWKPLSVSDLTGPAWCELQYDYGLRQKRHKKIQNRPDSFVSGQGKTITVVKKTAVSNDRTLKAGQAVHKRLEREVRPEREIRPEPARIAVTSVEETWGLRLINMLACVQDLLDLGFCREMPVFGLIHDHIVIGIVDEISHKPISDPGPCENGKKRCSTSVPSTLRKPKRARSTQAPAGLDLNAFFNQIPHQGTSSDTPFPSVPITHILQLFDSKTRYSRNLPSDRDMQPSRLQLMLYHRLLTGLVSASPQEALDLGDFWSRVQVNPKKSFSPSFCRESGLPSRNEEVDGEQQQHPVKAWCLNDLIDLWTLLIASLGISGVDRSLTLVYRTRGSDNVREEGPPGGIRRTDDRSKGQSTEEEMQMAQAIKESLLYLGADDDAALAQALAESLRHSQVVDGECLEANKTKELNIEVVVSNPPKGPGPTSVSAPQWEINAGDIDEEEIEEQSDVLGSKTFPFDKTMLDNHLDQVFDWWHGIRPPKGVEVADLGRCRSCEYRDDCEWRDSKARDALERVRSPGLC